MDGKSTPEPGETLSADLVDRGILDAGEVGSEYGVTRLHLIASNR